MGNRERRGGEGRKRVGEFRRDCFVHLLRPSLFLSLSPSPSRPGGEGKRKGEIRMHLQGGRGVRNHENEGNEEPRPRTERPRRGFAGASGAARRRSRVLEKFLGPPPCMAITNVRLIMSCTCAAELRSGTSIKRPREQFISSVRYREREGGREEGTDEADHSTASVHYPVSFDCRLADVERT